MSGFNRQRTRWPAVPLILALIGLSLGLWGCSLLPAPVSPSVQNPTRRAAVTPTAQPRSTPRPRSTSAPAPARRATNTPASAPTAIAFQPIAGFDTVTADQLPKQARETLALIARGGPFPYRQDGAVFQNRERRLPRQPSGYYHEYTVETPGSPDRGARRIITGAGGEIFYTGDHYASFVQVLPS